MTRIGRQRVAEIFRPRPPEVGVGGIDQPYVSAPTARLTPVPTENLYPAVFMVKPAEDRPRGDATEPLNWTNKGCILAQG